jgi:hypothetical protein
MSGEFYRLIYPVIRPPLVASRFVLGKLYSLFFGKLEIRIARKNEERLKNDLHEALSFCFSDYGAQIVPNEGVRFPPPMDYATVTLLIRNLLLRFTRGDSSLGVQVSPESLPHEWHQFVQVLGLISATGQSEPAQHFPRLVDIAQVLRPNMGRLIEVYSDDRLVETKEKLSEIDSQNYEITRRQEARINRKLYGP